MYISYSNNITAYEIKAINNIVEMKDGGAINVVYSNNVSIT